MNVPSLRKRLILIILGPLILISALAGYWRYSVAQNTAEVLFDRSLLAVAIAISRDVSVSGGDALSPVTRDLMRNAAEGEVFYHVYGPDGVYMTGYATPPVLPAVAARNAANPVTFSAVYRGQEVRAVRLQESSSVEGLTGLSTVTVWQTLENRERLAAALALRATVLILVLILTVAAVVWFGVQWGLRPLTNLEAAVSQRDSNDLRPIKRALPSELSGLVATLNSLFGRLQRSIESKEVFISNAAHQLRNPVAGVLSLAQSLETAPSDAQRNARVGDLVAAARHASRLTTQLLSYERAQADLDAAQTQPFDCVETVRTVVDRLAPKVLRSGIDLSFETSVTEARVIGDSVLLGEAIDNLIDNACKHGGEKMTRIRVDLRAWDGHVSLQVCDNGQGIAQKDYGRALSRFSQVNGGTGSGLGLPIAASAAKAMGGQITLKNAEPGLCVTIFLPGSHDKQGLSAAAQP